MSYEVWPVAKRDVRYIPQLFNVDDLRNMILRSGKSMFSKLYYYDSAMQDAPQAYLDSLEQMGKDIGYYIEIHDMPDGPGYFREDRCCKPPLGELGEYGLLVETSEQSNVPRPRGGFYRNWLVVATRNF